MMKSVFSFYKTPTMTECSSLGKEIGLQKRVVQVWFQNARAKEKKAKLCLQQATGGSEPEGPPIPDECSICNLKFTAEVTIQDHLFNKNHQENVRISITNGHYDPESPGDSLNAAAAAITNNSNNNDTENNNSASPQPSNNQPPNNVPPQLQIPPPPQKAIQEDQMPTPLPPNKKIQSESGNGNREEMEKTLMQQLYGVGHGISSYPTGVATANPFLHPAMFSASGK